MTELAKRLASVQPIGKTQRNLKKKRVKLLTSEALQSLLLLTCFLAWFIELILIIFLALQRTRRYPTDIPASLSGYSGLATSLPRSGCATALVSQSIFRYTLTMTALSHGAKRGRCT